MTDREIINLCSLFATKIRNSTDLAEVGSLALALQDVCREPLDPQKVLETWKTRRFYQQDAALIDAPQLSNEFRQRCQARADVWAFCIEQLEQMLVPRLQNEGE